MESSTVSQKNDFTIITFRVSTETYNKIKEAAKQKQLSLSGLVRESISKFCKIPFKIRQIEY